MKTQEGTKRRIKAIEEIRSLKIKCSRCNRAYASSFYLGKPYCQRCNPKPRKRPYLRGGFR